MAAAFLRPVAAVAAAVLSLVVPAFGEEDEREPSILDSVPALSRLKEARDALADRGVWISGFYFSDPRGNLSGGIEPGWTYSGLFKLRVDLDGEKVFGIAGGRLHADMLQIHGRDVSEDYVGNILSANDVGARPATRLFEFYWDQELTETLSVRLGQQAADEVFMTSEYGENFLDATFGWAGPPSENLPFGGPAYPLAAPGGQVTWTPSEAYELVAAVYNGYTARPGAEDPEKANRHGLNFRVGDPPLLIVENRIKYELGGGDGLSGGLKFGFYAHFGKFDDLKRGTDGLVLGEAGSNGEPRRRRGTVNGFAVLDQQIWRKPGDDPEKGVGIFARVIAGQKDRNEIDFYLDGGIVASGLVPGRPDDVVGLAAAFANFSSALADADRAENRASGIAGPESDYEAVLEATYRAQIVPGLTVQPTFQYVFHPGGGEADPDRPRRRIPDAKIFGVATIVRF